MSHPWSAALCGVCSGPGGWRAKEAMQEGAHVRGLLRCRAHPAAHEHTRRAAPIAGLPALPRLRLHSPRRRREEEAEEEARLAREQERLRQQFEADQGRQRAKKAEKVGGCRLQGHFRRIPCQQGSAVHASTGLPPSALCFRAGGGRR